ncbi:MAG: hypothetical protein M1142_03245 [Patescibacteria group bacterium]|nr:hypothetical protein [Patescibacteria group bacterium]
MWVSLPQENHVILAGILSPIRDLCIWCTTVEMNKKANTIPHITLRYLGYDSEKLRKKVEQDKELFRKTITTLL